MKEFEYKVTSIPHCDLVTELNKLGNNGWEVSSLLDQEKYDKNLWYKFLLKRELVYQRNPMECGPL